MSKLSSRQSRLAKQFNLPTPEDLIAAFEKDSSLAADVFIDVLNTMIKSINANSRSKVLEGYEAVKEPFTQKVRLPKSGLSLDGKYEWVVYVKAPRLSKRNIFDTIDQGRPQLPYRVKPYALYGAALRSVPNSAVRRNKVPFPSNARLSGSPTSLSIGSYPLSEGQVSVSRKMRGRKGPKVSPMVFSRGPLTAIPAKFLYENAIKRAKDRLSVKGLSQFFDIVLVQREEFGAE